MNSIKALWRKFGYYIALLAIVAIVGIGAYAIRNRPGATLPAQPPAPPRQAAASFDETLEKKPTSDKLIWPLSSREVITLYSPAQPIWSDMVEMYMTHDGVDILALPGEAVLAAMKGEVVSIYFDEMLGNTIELKHEGGIRTIYSNLSTLNLVKIGQSVRQGEVISAVGSTSRLESDMQPHLHFEAYENGAWLDLPRIIE